MSNNQQSSIDFIYDSLRNYVRYDNRSAVEIFDQIFEQAKAMHKEEINDAYFLGYGDHQTLDWHDLDEYYNETFGE